MPILSRLCRGTLVLGLIASTAAHADVTPDQAAALQKQLHDWVAGVVGPGIDVPQLPLRFSPEGDHYRVQADVAGTFAGSGVTIEGGPWTATVHPLEGNRWAIDNMKLPSPLKVINAGGPPGMQGNFTLRIAEQENHSIFDPALATTSSSDGRVRGLSQTTETSLGKQSTEVAQMVWHQSLQPTDGGRQNLVMESTLEGYASNQPTKEGPPVSIAIERMRQTGHADAIDFARVGTMIRGFVALGRLASDTGRKPDSKMTSAERDLVRSVAGALSDALTLVDGEQTMEGVRIKAAGFSGKIAKLAMGFGFGAPKGESEIHLRLAMDGIDSPDVPPGAFRDIVPRHVGISPRLSGIPKDDLVRLMNAAIDSGGDDTTKLQQEAMEVLEKSPLTFGIDDLVLDIGIAKLTGNGELDVSSPADISGEAELRLTGFDALLRKVGATAEFKVAAPVLIFLKGIGERDGNDMVWKVKYEDSKVSVNGTDLSDMIPKGK